MKIKKPQNINKMLNDLKTKTVSITEDFAEKANKSSKKVKTKAKEFAEKVDDIIDETKRAYLPPKSGLEKRSEEIKLLRQKLNAKEALSIRLEYGTGNEYQIWQNNKEIILLKEQINKKTQEYNKFAREQSIIQAKFNELNQ